MAFMRVCMNTQRIRNYVRFDSVENSFELLTQKTGIPRGCVIPIEAQVSGSIGVRYYILRNQFDSIQLISIITSLLCQRCNGSVPDNYVAATEIHICDFQFQCPKVIPKFTIVSELKYLQKPNKKVLKSVNGKLAGEVLDF